MIKIIINHETKKSINVEKKAFKGDVEAAVSAIETYTRNHPGSSKSYGYGYGEVVLGKEKHPTNPYGIDMNMMIEWCHLSADDFKVAPIPSNPVKASTFFNQKTESSRENNPEEIGVMPKNR